MRKRKKVRNGVRKGELGFKKEGAFRLLCVIAASLPALKPAEFAFFLRQRIQIQKRHWRTAAAKSGGIWSVLRAEAFVSCVDSGLFFERIGTF